MELHQRLSNRLRHQPPHLRFAMKLHFPLGGMNVDIHRRRINFQKKAADRVAPSHQRSVIALQEREIDPAILDWSPVHKDMLVLPGGTGNPWRAHETP